MQDYSEKWKAERERAAFLVLADGTVFRGVAFGARQDRLGEAVFNTGMSGYQEILTDPSYAGQFVALTTAEIGNYGINPEDVESRGLFLSGLVVNDLTEPSNYRSKESIDAYLARHGVPGIYGVDVRALTLHLRDHGSQRAYLHVGKVLDGLEGLGNLDDLARAAAEMARAWEGLDGQDYAAKVSCTEFYEFAPAGTEVRTPATRPLVVCYDFGVKTNILRNLAEFSRVVVVPAKTPAASVRALKPDGVFLSNGPADPAALPYAAANIRDLLGLDGRGGKPIPTMGICLGHQLLSIACGAKTGRLKFGHHGCNHPVKNLATGHVEITSQNHNFAVQDASVPDCLEVTHVNLNDNTIEGVRHRTLPAFSVQYHPESCPGPHDSKYLFGQFRSLMEQGMA